MAGDWIKVEHATLDKPEIDQIASITGLDHDAVLGKCIRLWVWADQQSVDGDAISVTNAFLDRLVFHPGFAKALQSTGWLKGRDGHLSIPNFARHNGESAKKRGQSLKRMRKKRECDATSVTSALPEKEIEKEIEKSNTHTHASGFEDAWDRWRKYITSTVGRWNEIQGDTWLMELGRRGPEKAKRDIEFSISKGAKSILDSDDDFSKRGSGSTRKAKGLEGVI